MGHEQDEFADFYRASRDSCLRAVTAVVGDRERAEEQVAEALAQHGIPALVTVGSFCRTTPLAPVPFGQVVQPETLADGSDAIVINGQAMPPGAELSIAIFPQTVRMVLIEKGAPLSCFSTPGQPGQPAIHVLPTGTPTQG